MGFFVCPLGQDLPEPSVPGARLIFCRRFTASCRPGDPVCGFFCDLCRGGGYFEETPRTGAGR